jgi:hypothetical protein
MSKRLRESRDTETPMPGKGGPQNPSLPGWILLLGMGLVIAVTVVNYQATRDLRKTLDSRLVQVDQRIGQMATKLDTVASAAPRRSGPDPARVYAVKTEAAPAKGPADAPVTIAEFSDFQ